MLIREGRGGPEVLLGRRHRSHRFLPDIYVFPGGRLDAADSRPSGFPESVAQGLHEQWQPSARRRPALAFLRAAIRETFEEAGLLVAREGVLAAPHAQRDDVWQAFRRSGVVPGFEAVAFICRAITPASSPRRYDTRFFLAEASPDAADPTGDGELEDLRWWPLAETERLGLVDVTEFVLQEALARRRARSRPLPPVPLLCYRRDVMRLLRRRPASAPA